MIAVKRQEDSVEGNMETQEERSRAGLTIPSGDSRPTSAGRSTFEAFQGLAPILIALVPLSLGQWGIGLVVMLGGSLILTTRELPSDTASRMPTFLSLASS